MRNTEVVTKLDWIRLIQEFCHEGKIANFYVKVSEKFTTIFFSLVSG